MNKVVKKSKSLRQPSGQANTAIVNNLITLIQSLTQAQKRDFKKFSQFYGQKSDRKYLRLFDHVNRFISSRKPSEQIMAYLIIQKGFESRELVNAQSRYLLDKILLSLRTMPELRPRQQRLYGTLQDIQMLYHQGLQEECSARVEEALRSAAQLNRHGLVLELLNWKIRLFIEPPNVDAQIQFREHIKEKVERLLPTIHQENDLYYLAMLIHNYYLQNKPIPADLLQEVQEKLYAPDPEPFPILSHIWKLFGLYYYYELQNRLAGTSQAGNEEQRPLERAVGCLEEILEIFNVEQPMLVEEEPELYNRALENYMSLCVRTARYPELARLEEKIESDKNDLELTQTAAHYRLQLLVSTGAFEKAYNYIITNHLWDRLEHFKHRMRPSRLRILYFTCGQTLFIRGKYKDSVDWLNALIDERKSKAHPQAVLVTGMLLAINQFEAGRKDLQPLLRSIRRGLNQAGPYQEVSGSLLDLLRLMFRQPSPPKLSLLLSKINLAREKIMEHQRFHVFGVVLAWMEARLNGTSVEAEVTKYNQPPQRRP